MSKKTTIITGFLGAGKTTYLNHVLKSNPNIRYAIIENEFGEQSIDSELIIRSDDNIVEMNNGCLCCTLNDNLYDILNELHQRKDDFDELIIEATGVADPAGIAEPFISHPAIKKEFLLINTICLVDAELIEDQLKETEEAIKQIAFSDILIINKVDLVDSTYTQTLKEILVGIKPLAKAYTGEKGKLPISIPPNTLFDAKEVQKNHHAHEHAHTHTSSGSFPVEKPHHHHHHEHGDIISHTFTFTAPFNVESLYHRLFQFLMFQSKGVYRVKGFIYCLELENQVILQSVGNRVGLEEGRKWMPDEQRKSTIVFIGKNLKKEGLQKMLEQNLVHQKV